MAMNKGGGCIRTQNLLRPLERKNDSSAAPEAGKEITDSLFLNKTHDAKRFLMGSWNNPPEEKRAAVNDARALEAREEVGLKKVKTGRENNGDNNREEHTGDFRPDFGRKTTALGVNTTRSKHSATEQRRRSKINERFQKLRDLIPHNDQRRDKASLLLEVIEYIQFLREKIQRYDPSFDATKREPARLLSWRNNYRLPEKSFSQSLQSVDDLDHTDPSSMQSAERNFFPPNNLCHPQSAPEPENHAESSSLISLPSPSPAPSSMSDPHLNQSRRAMSSVNNEDDRNDSLENPDLFVQDGIIKISTIYSHGLLHSLSDALNGSGLDLSEAHISLLIKLGRQVTE